MVRYLLDTNVISELRKSPHRINDGVVQWVKSVRSADLYICAITLYELELGVRRKEWGDPVQGKMLREWLNGAVRQEFSGRILPFDSDAALLAASFCVPDKKPQADSYIAAIALVNRMTLITRNTGDFNYPGLAVINPFK